MNYKNKNRNIFFIILIIFLITSFVVCANSQNLSFTNIWYKKMPNYTHITIKASDVISEYEVSYLDSPERIIIDVKNAEYTIEELSKNILFLNMGEVKQVRCGQLENEPVPVTRFVVDLFQKTNYEVTLASENRLIYIDVYDYEEFSAPEEQTFTVTPVKSEDIKIEKPIEPKISILDIYTEPVNLNIFEEDIVNVIRGLSELTGVDIMLDDSVSGLLTLNLKNKTFRETIELILMNKGLDYTEISDTLVIASKEIIQGYIKPVTKIVELKHATAEEAKGILDGYKTENSSVNIVADARTNTLFIEGTEDEIKKVINLLPNIDTELLTRTYKIENAIEKEEIDAIKNMLGIIIPKTERINIDSRQSEIIVKGTNEELDAVSEVIKGLDKRAPQIMLEAKVVEIILDDEKDLGIKWTSGGNEGQISIGEITLGGSFERNGLIEATLKALQSEAKTNMLSNPKVLTLDGKEGYMKSTTDIPIIEEKESDGVVVQTVSWKPVGIELTITPRLSADEFITMNVVTSVKSLGTEFIQGYPVINDRTETAIIRTKLGETTVIGGLISSEDIKTNTEIPILGKIPIFGELFKFTRSTNKKSEIIILITTHLLDY